MAGEVKTIGNTEISDVKEMKVHRHERHSFDVPGLIELVKLIQEGKSVKVEQIPLPMTFQSQRALHQMELLTEALIDYGVRSDKETVNLLHVATQLHNIANVIAESNKLITEKTVAVTVQAPDLTVMAPDVHVRTHDTEELLTARQTISVHPVKMGVLPWVIFGTLLTFMSVILWRLW